MKLFMRVGIMALLAVCVMAWAGPAWAEPVWTPQTADAVKQAIEKFDLTATVSGNTITVTNKTANPLVQGVSSFLGYDSSLLYLDDITGLTIDWKANLTVTGKLSLDKDIKVLCFRNGTFNMTAGTIDIRTTGTGGTDVIRTYGASTITLDGGTIQGTNSATDSVAFTDTDESEGRWLKVILKSGKLNFPHSFAMFANELVVDDADMITGVAALFTVDEKEWEINIYGETDTPIRSMLPDDMERELTSLKYIVKSNAEWTVSAEQIAMGSKTTTLTVEEGGELILTPGTLNIYGTLRNRGKFTNSGTINNYSANTLDNQGTITNEGTINNTATGKITNTGKIISEGKIDNKGTIDNPGEIQSDPANFSGNEPMGNTVVPIGTDDPDDDQKGSSSSGGGCNSGYGLFGLLPLAVWVARKRMTA